MCLLTQEPVTSLPPNTCSPEENWLQLNEIAHTTSRSSGSGRRRACVWLQGGMPLRDTAGDLTLQIRDTGMLLNVLSMLAFTPGGGSNTKMRPARSKFTGT